MELWNSNWETNSDPEMWIELQSKFEKIQVSIKIDGKLINLTIIELQLARLNEHR